MTTSISNSSKMHSSSSSSSSEAAYIPNHSASVHSLDSSKCNKNEQSSNSFLDFLDKVFAIKKRGSSVLTEFIAAIVTFVTAIYIIPVHANILADSGGICIEEFGGSFPGFDDPEFNNCIEEIRQEFVTTSLLLSIIGSALMGLWANLPFAIMPGMGMNAYFVYTVVGWMGTGSVKYSTAVTAVVLEGITFFLISITGLRSVIRYVVPQTVAAALPVGTGLFLAFIGLQASNGLGIITKDSATLVTLGGCPPENRVFASPEDSSYQCAGGRMADPKMWLGISGLILIIIFSYNKFRASFLWGMLFVCIIAWIPGHSASVFASSADPSYKEFLKVVAVPKLGKSLGHMDFSQLQTSDFWVAFGTLLYTDLLDSTGTFVALGHAGDLLVDGSRVRAERAAFSCDALSTLFAGLMGSSPCTSVSENSAGILAGGRTGLTALFMMIFFTIALFFTPVLSAIPSYATGPALIMVGALMASNVTKIEWSNTKKAATATVTLLLVPLTYSIAYGLIFGVSISFILEIIDFTTLLITGRKSINDVLLSFKKEFKNAFKCDKDKSALLETYGIIRHGEFENRNGSNFEVDEKQSSSQSSADIIND